MDGHSKQITALVASGIFFLSLPFLMQEKLAEAKPVDRPKPAPPVAKKIKKKPTRAPASIYSVDDFKAEKVLNKKVLSPKQYDDALKASKHVGISYKPHVEPKYKLTEADVIATRKIEEAMRIARKKRDREEAKTK